MRRNIEIKARLPDWDAAVRAATQIVDGSPELLEQEDVFYMSDRGRLKLRLVNGKAELIYYERPDEPGLKQSDFLVLPVTEPQIARDMLERLHGSRRTVRKKRWLYLSGQTRIHLDRVEELGDFVELEVMLRDDQSAADGVRIANDLLAKLGVTPEHYVNCAYIDLLPR
jgi:predicted adenylyl cyclase CyaB